MSEPTDTSVVATVAVAERLLLEALAEVPHDEVAEFANWLLIASQSWLHSKRMPAQSMVMSTLGRLLYAVALEHLDESKEEV